MDTVRNKRADRRVGQRAAGGGADAAAGGGRDGVFWQGAGTRDVRAGVQSAVRAGLRADPIPVSREDEGKTSKHMAVTQICLEACCHVYSAVYTALW